MKRLIPWLLLAALACQSGRLASAPIPTPYPPEYLPTVIGMTAAALASPMPPSLTPSPTQPSPTPTITRTPAPFEQYTIDYLRQRSYGGGAIEIVKTMDTSDQFTRYLIRFPSDGLTMYGYMNVPPGTGSHPVVIVIHGLTDSGTFNSLTFANDMTDTLARAGYLVIFPILRGYPPSASGDNMFRVGMSVDILNLIAHIKTQGGQAGLLAQADPARIGLLGHSMGGDIALRVLTISTDIKAAVLYASLSGNEIKNSQQLYNISLEPQFQNELNTLPSMMPLISPVYYFGNVSAPIQLYHGTSDETVPVTWAQETCSFMSAAGKNINCIYYEGAGHIFGGSIKDKFFESMLLFYGMHLSQ